MLTIKYNKMMIDHGEVIDCVFNVSGTLMESYERVELIAKKDGETKKYELELDPEENTMRLTIPGGDLDTGRWYYALIAYGENGKVKLTKEPLLIEIFPSWEES